MRVCAYLFRGHRLFCCETIEQEHHLQRAICTGLIIPTPEVFDIDQEFYDRIYPENFKVSRQLIRMQRECNCVILFSVARSL